MNKDKIIYRRNKLIEFSKTEAKPYTLWHDVIDENINSINYLLYKLEAYENMRKDLLDLILYQYPALSQSESDFKDDLLNILNKVGGSDEN